MGREHPTGNEIRKLFRAKAERRQGLSRLSFEKKIFILLSLQGIADEVRSLAGRVKRHRWAANG